MSLFLAPPPHAWERTQEDMFRGDHDPLPPQELDDPLPLMGLLGVLTPDVSVGWGQDYAMRPRTRSTDVLPLDGSGGVGKVTRHMSTGVVGICLSYMRRPLHGDRLG